MLVLVTNVFIVTQVILGTVVLIAQRASISMNQVERNVFTVVLVITVTVVPIVQLGNMNIK
jgi:hypothetical protein